MISTRVEELVLVHELVPGENQQLTSNPGVVPLCLMVISDAEMINNNHLGTSDMVVLRPAIPCL